MRRLTALVIALFLITAALAGCAGANVKRGPEVGLLAPDFQLKNLAGKPVTLASLQGKPVFLNFWATWCPPCRAEMPDLNVMYQKYGDRIHFLAINVGESAKPVRQFLATNNLTFPVALDSSNSVASTYRVNGIPTSLVLDSKGIIRGKQVGMLTAQQMEGLIKKVLQ